MKPFAAIPPPNESLYGATHGGNFYQAFCRSCLTIKFQDFAPATGSVQGYPDLTCPITAWIAGH